MEDAGFYDHFLYVLPGLPPFFRIAVQN